MTIVRSLTPDQYAATGIDHRVADVDQHILKVGDPFQLQRKIMPELPKVCCKEFAHRALDHLVPAMRDAGFARHLLLPESIFERETKKIAIDAQLAQRAVGCLFEQNDVDFHAGTLINDCAKITQLRMNIKKARRAWMGAGPCLHKKPIAVVSRQHVAGAPLPGTVFHAPNVRVLVHLVHGISAAMADLMGL